MGAVSDTQHAEGEASVQSARAARRGDVTAASPTPDLSRSPANLLALQRAIGNASVARLIGASERADGRSGACACGAGQPCRCNRHEALTARPNAFGSTLTTGGRALQQAVARLAHDGAQLSTAPRRVVARGFWGRVWGGIKGAASAVGGAVKGAATAVGGAVKSAATAVAGAVESVASSIWDGAKRAGSWAVDWLKSAGSAVWDALKWFGSGAWDVIKVIGTWAWEKLSLLGSLAWDFVSFLPARLWRLVIDGWDAVSGILNWLWKGLSEGVSWAWAWDGFKRGLSWCLDTFIDLLQLVGIGDALQFVWGLIFHTRPLTDDERRASESVHGTGLIPYWRVRVDQDSFMIKLGVWLGDLFGTKTKPLAITTMHIIQAPATFDLAVAVHELTHVAQYQKIGAVYMPQALHAQGSAMGYDYGDLTAARGAGKHFSDFNREQQASICEDYYRVNHGNPAEYHAAEAELEPFVGDMRSGAF